MKTLKCDGREGCDVPVSHIEDKGWIYCTQHALHFRSCGRRLRKLTTKELAVLQEGKPLSSYRRTP